MLKLSEAAVLDYGNAGTAVTGWGDNTMLAFAGIGQSTVAQGNDISGMGDIFNTASVPWAKSATRCFRALRPPPKT